MSGPLIVQSDRTVLLEVAHPDAEDARHDLAVFAELERAPEHMHTYRITRLGLWNACAAGHTADSMIATLQRYSRFPIPRSVSVDIADTVARYGRLVIDRDGDGVLTLRSTDAAVLTEVVRAKRIAPLITGTLPDGARTIEPWARGQLKQELVKLGWPAEDLAGYTPGTPHPIALDETDWQLRPYQRAGRRQLLRRRIRRGRAAVRRGQDPGRRGRDGGGQDEHARAGDQHRGRPAVAQRTAAAHLAHRGGDRRVLRGR